MKRKHLSVIAVFAAFILSATLTACDITPNEPPKTLQNYTVSFDANGGALTGEASVTVKEGDKITVVPTALREYYVFDAWYDAATGGTKIELDAYTATQDVTLYAHYVPYTPAQTAENSETRPLSPQKKRTISIRS